jgi:hypothetical protein
VVPRVLEQAILMAGVAVGFTIAIGLLHEPAHAAEPATDQVRGIDFGRAHRAAGGE